MPSLRASFLYGNGIKHKKNRPAVYCRTGRFYWTIFVSSRPQYQLLDIFGELLDIIEDLVDKNVILLDTF